jgi:hypothetical protein
MYDTHKLREIFIESLIKIFRTIFFWIDNDKELGRAILAVHPFLILIPIAIFFSLGRLGLLKLILLLLGFCLASSQIIFKGCVLTAAERRLTGEKKTVMDPVLKLMPFIETRDFVVGLTIGLGLATAGIASWVVLIDCSVLVCELLNTNMYKLRYYMKILQNPIPLPTGVQQLT